MDNIGVQLVQILAAILTLSTLLGVVLGLVLLWIYGVKRQQVARLAYARAYVTGRCMPPDALARDFDELAGPIANRAPPTFQSRIGSQSRLNQRV